MRRRRIVRRYGFWKIGVVGILLLALLVVGSQGSHRAAARPLGSANVAVRPITQAVYVGQVFTVYIRIEGSGNVVGADMWLHFDSNALEALSLSDGGVLDVRLGGSIDNQNGVVKYGAGTFGNPKTPPFTLCIIRFRAKGPLGSTPLTLDASHTDVQSPDGSILGSLISGQVVVTPAPTPTPTPTVTPTPPPTSTPTPTPTASPTPTFTPTPTPLPVRICAFSYHDVNRNGHQDGDEPLLAGAKISLRNEGQSLLAEMTTKTEGPVCFPQCPAGVYVLQEENPPGFSSTTPDVWGLYVTSGTTVTIPFGDVLTHGYVEGTLFEDEDRDGQQNSGERAIPHARVRLEKASSGRAPNQATPPLETETDEDGHFVFDEVPWGTYDLEVTEVPPGFLAPPPVTLTVEPDTHYQVIPLAAPPVQSQVYIPLMVK